MPFVTFEDKVIPYQMRRSTRAKRLRIELASSRVELVLPMGLSNQEALLFLLSKKKWVAKHWAKHKSQSSASAIWPERWEAGAKVLFLGVPYRLEILVEKEAKSQVSRDDTTLQLIVKANVVPVSDVTQTMVLAYLKNQADKLVLEAIQTYCPRLRKWPAGHKLKQTKRRWGSCGINNHIYINWLLILAPKGALEYVVVHELCHLVYRSHGPRFWQLVGKMMPEYKIHEKWLSQNGNAILSPELLKTSGAPERI